MRRKTLPPVLVRNLSTLAETTLSFVTPAEACRITYALDNDVHLAEAPPIEQGEYVVICGDYCALLPRKDHT